MTALERALSVIAAAEEESYEYCIDDSYGIVSRLIAEAIRASEDEIKERAAKLIDEMAECADCPNPDTVRGLAERVRSLK